MKRLRSALARTVAGAHAVSDSVKQLRHRRGLDAGPRCWARRVPALSTLALYAAVAADVPVPGGAVAARVLAAVPRMHEQVDAADGINTAFMIDLLAGRCAVFRPDARVFARAAHAAKQVLGSKAAEVQQFLVATDSFLGPYLLDLVVFPADTPVPVAVASVLWRACSDSMLQVQDAAVLLQRLAGLGAVWMTKDSQSFAVYDLTHILLSQHASSDRITRLHRHLVNHAVARLRELDAKVVRAHQLGDGDTRIDSDADGDDDGDGDDDDDDDDDHGDDGDGKDALGAGVGGSELQLLGHAPDEAEPLTPLLDQQSAQQQRLKKQLLSTNGDAKQRSQGRHAIGSVAAALRDNVALKYQLEWLVRRHVVSAGILSEFLRNVVFSVPWLRQRFLLPGQLRELSWLLELPSALSSSERVQVMDLYCGLNRASTSEFRDVDIAFGQVLCRDPQHPLCQQLACEYPPIGAQTAEPGDEYFVWMPTLCERSSRMRFGTFCNAGADGRIMSVLAHPSFGVADVMDPASHVYEPWRGPGLAARMSRLSWTVHACWDPFRSVMWYGSTISEHPPVKTVAIMALECPAFGQARVSPLSPGRVDVGQQLSVVTAVVYEPMTKTPLMIALTHADQQVVVVSMLSGRVCGVAHGTRWGGLPLSTSLFQRVDDDGTTSSYILLVRCWRFDLFKLDASLSVRRTTFISPYPPPPWRQDQADGANTDTDVEEPENHPESSWNRRSRAASVVTPASVAGPPRLAVATRGNFLNVIDCQSLKRVRAIRMGPVNGLRTEAVYAFSPVAAPNTAMALVQLGDYRALIYNLDTGAALAQFEQRRMADDHALVTEPGTRHTLLLEQRAQRVRVISLDAILARAQAKRQSLVGVAYRAEIDRSAAGWEIDDPDELGIPDLVGVGAGDDGVGDSDEGAAAPLPTSVTAAHGMNRLAVSFPVCMTSWIDATGRAIVAVTVSTTWIMLYDASTGELVRVITAARSVFIHRVSIDGMAYDRTDDGLEYLYVSTQCNLQVFRINLAEDKREPLDSNLYMTVQCLINNKELGKRWLILTNESKTCAVELTSGTNTLLCRRRSRTMWFGNTSTASWLLMGHRGYLSLVNVETGKAIWRRRCGRVRDLGVFSPSVGAGSAALVISSSFARYHVTITAFDVATDKRLFTLSGVPADVDGWSSMAAASAVLTCPRSGDPILVMVTMERSYLLMWNLRSRRLIYKSFLAEKMLDPLICVVRDHIAVTTPYNDVMFVPLAQLMSLAC